MKHVRPSPSILLLGIAEPGQDNADRSECFTVPLARSPSGGHPAREAADEYRRPSWRT